MWRFRVFIVDLIHFRLLGVCFCIALAGFSRRWRICAYSVPEVFLIDVRDFISKRVEVLEKTKKKHVVGRFTGEKGYIRAGFYIKSGILRENAQTVWILRGILYQVRAFVPLCDLSYIVFLVLCGLLREMEYTGNLVCSGYFLTVFSHFPKSCCKKYEWALNYAFFGVKLWFKKAYLRANS